MSNQFIDAHASAKKLSSKVVPFNIDYLDDVARGIYPTDVVLISAATGAGKTHIASVMAERSARAGKRVGFFALEAHRLEIEQRILFREMAAYCREHEVRPPGFGYSSYMYNPGVWDGLASVGAKRLTDALGGRLNMHYGGSSFTPADVKSSFDACRGHVDLLVLDHFCLLYTSPSPRDQRGSRMPSSA